MDSPTDADIDENILITEDESPAFANRREDDGAGDEEIVEKGALGRFGTVKHVAAALGGWHWVRACMCRVHGFEHACVRNWIFVCM